MKPFILNLVFAALLPFVLSGCGGTSKTTLDASKLDQGFQSATGERKSDASAAAAAIRSGDLASACASMEKIVSAGGLSDTERTALTDALIDMQKVAYEKPEKYSDDVRAKISALSTRLAQ